MNAVLILICLAASEPPATRPEAVETASRRARLANVRDRTTSVEEHALYSLLPEAARLDPGATVEAALTVRRRYLMEEPELYRGRLVKLSARLAEVARVEPADRMLWPRPVWVATGLVSDEDNEPVTVVLTDDPGKVPKWASVWMAGYFYKLRTDQRRSPDRQSGAAEVTLPILVGRSLAVVRPPPASLSRRTLTLIALVCLLALYLTVRRAARKAGRLPTRREPVGRETHRVQTPPEQLEIIKDKDAAEALDILSDARPRADATAEDKPHA